MEIPNLVIGKHTARLPLVQGGMGVGISLSGLASAVAREGAVGVISAVEIGMSEPDYRENKREANVRALRAEILRARELAPEGVIGVNVMVALNNYEEMVSTAVAAGADLVIVGAGLPLGLPALVADSDTAAVPIVSSAKAIQLIGKRWDTRFRYCPDAVVVEGPLAGGHLGFSFEELQHPETVRLEDIVVEVMEAVRPLEDKYGRPVPVIAAGGIYDGADIARFLCLGCAGVQMGTRFVATFECDAAEEFKQAYLRARAEDVEIIRSPVGMPGRAIHNQFLERVQTQPEKIKCRYNCLRPCDPRTAPYCIADALINAKLGRLDQGFAFAGANVYRVDRIVSVHDLITQLMEETSRHLAQCPSPPEHGHRQ
ncbi:MAG: nitronate monooxygenase family protein [Syntrophomonadaceae bacterium]|nr:nitronate monooxygenase family protein [Syntrophomonadaceae bacterium]MDH7498261.1 nitronate monooxygenase family protein [Syntrophomonadaceae bacterium]